MPSRDQIGYILPAIATYIDACLCSKNPVKALLIKNNLNETDKVKIHLIPNRISCRCLRQSTSAERLCMYFI